MVLTWEGTEAGGEVVGGWVGRGGKGERLAMGCRGRWLGRLRLGVLGLCGVV